MLKITKRSLFSLLAVLFVVVGFSIECLAQKATEEMFTKEGLEYHFLLSDVQLLGSGIGNSVFKFRDLIFLVGEQI